ncbi:MAG: oxalate:formate antiporter [Planctomycetes bacterium B3_Pla]|nr:MAG: oxalate:formate antiporter [Planctomycetes bacterium B3_Pla]
MTTSEETTESKPEFKNHGWRVTFAGMGINLALGILYTWSVISKHVPDEWGWSENDKSLPYMVACLIFSLVMVPAGRMQDKIGPRRVATIGGVLVGLGFVLASMTSSLVVFVIGFGVLAGAGIGFGYASATPPAVKWFPPAKTGLIAGIVVSGFGLASVYAAPLSRWLIIAFSFKTAILVLGIGFLIVVVSLAQLIKPPHKVLQFIEEYGEVGRLKQQAMAKEKAEAEGRELPASKKEEFAPREMVRTVQFYLLWFMYACGAGAGLMIISKLAAIAKIQADIKLGFVLVAVLAVGNGGGRIVAGMLSDRIGRKATMIICFVFQAVLIILLSQASDKNGIGTIPAMAIISALIGANYGANLTLFPSITKDFYGLKSFGMNYGLVFTSWGVGGFMLAYLAGRMYQVHQTFSYAYYGASTLLILAAITAIFLKPPHHTIEAA